MNAETHAVQAIDESMADGNAPESKALKAPVKNSARSQRNIEAWRSYLPPECVAVMIAMGWDEST